MEGDDVRKRTRDNNKLYWENGTRKRAELIQINMLFTTKSDRHKTVGSIYYFFFFFCSLIEFEKKTLFSSFFSQPPRGAENGVRNNHETDICRKLLPHNNEGVEKKT